VTTANAHTTVFMGDVFIVRFLFGHTSFETVGG
jgi:hypothetical protein